jgi:hypothetical protein
VSSPPGHRSAERPAGRPPHRRRLGHGTSSRRKASRRLHPGAPTRRDPQDRRPDPSRPGPRPGRQPSPDLEDRTRRNCHDPGPCRQQPVATQAAGLPRPPAVPGLESGRRAACPSILGGGGRRVRRPGHAQPGPVRTVSLPTTPVGQGEGTAGNRRPSITTAAATVNPACFWGPPVRVGGGFLRVGSAELGSLTPDWGEVATVAPPEQSADDGMHRTRGLRSDDVTADGTVDRLVHAHLDDGPTRVRGRTVPVQRPIKSPPAGRAAGGRPACASSQ